MAGPEHIGTSAPGELDERVEAEGTVAAHARVGSQAFSVPVDERLHNGRAELLAEIERDVREPEPVAGLPRRDHGVGRAAGPLRARAGRVEPEAQRDADRVRSCAEERDGAVDATAHRNGDAARRRGRGEDRRDRVRERVGRERLTRNRGGLEQRETDERPLETGCIGLDDPVAVQRQPHGGVLLAARGISDQLECRHSVRLPAWLPGALPAFRSQVESIAVTEAELRA